MEHAEPRGQISITEFIAARLDEEERMARAAALRRGSPVWVVDPQEWATGIGIMDETGGSIAAVHGTYRAAHIAHWDPARVLAEVAAKRSLLDWAFEYGEERDHERGDGHNAGQIRAGVCGDYGSRDSLKVLLMLAAPYADHPDFDPAWTIGASH